MTPAELTAFGMNRHGRKWKKELGAEIGWSYWKLHRESLKPPEEPIDPKIEAAIKGLKPLK